MNRREFLAVGAALLAAPALDAKQDDTTVTQYVKPFIGTGGHGHCYPGATVPFGMVQLSPDTFNDGWDWCSGYHISDGSMMGFSHTHLSGTGIGDMLDFLLMPSTKQIQFEPGTRENPDAGYRSRFSHKDEAAEPGYYSVHLSDYKVYAEVTATERAGFHRYTFPHSDLSHFILDLQHAYGQHTKINGAHFEVAGSDTIVGGRGVEAWARGREIYFAMQFSKPFHSLQKSGLKAALLFPTGAGEVIQVKTGLSGVSIEGARKNLEREIPHWNFDETRKAAQMLWQRELGKIQIETPDLTKKKIFYTSLYHAYSAPTLFDDVDGSYRGMDGKVHSLPPGSHNYSTFSLWDTYRAEHPLFTLVQEERVTDFANCLIRMANESPAGLPVWPLQAKETGCMTGFHSVVVLAEAAEKDFSGIHFPAVYEPLHRRLMLDDYRGMDHYREFGYLPCDMDDESVSKSLGYAYDDYASSRILMKIGKDSEAKLLRARSNNYKNLFDASDCFLRPKLKSGKFEEPFNPKEIQISKNWKDFTESNSWQETFANQHDLKSYIQMFGGRKAFVAKLDALFDQPSTLPPDTPPDIAGLVGMYAHGNEPSHHVAYLYCYAGAAWKTQVRIRSLLETMYHDDPDGMAGNEDCGQMSAWYVMSALGFYAVDPASGNYVLGSPLFEKAVVRLGPGRELVIKAEGNHTGSPYVDSWKLNGTASSKVWFHHRDIKGGGEIRLTMSSQPNRSFGADEQDAPPTLA
jgi:predicted alpha-1,2-mannosidase